MAPSSGRLSAPRRTTPANSQRMRRGRVESLVFATLVAGIAAACAGPAAAPASPQAPALPCPGSVVHALLREGRLFSALRLAQAEVLATRPVRGAQRESARGICAGREERAALIARVLAELGACSEVRSLSTESLDCRPEPLPVRAALTRAAELRGAGRFSDAARISSRAIRAARAAGQRVRAIPLLPRRVDGTSVELTALEDALAVQYPGWETEPSVYFLAGSTCVGASCLHSGGRMVQMPGAELVNGFAPRRFDYPWRIHPGRRLTADAVRIVDHAARREVRLEVPAGVVPDRSTGSRLADLAFSHDGDVVWGLGSLGRLFAADVRTGRLLAEFDAARTCPRVQEPLRIVSASGADVAIAQIGTAPGCATLIHGQKVSALPFAAGSLLALSGDGRVAAVHHQGRVTSYDLTALGWLDPPEPPSFAAPEVSRLGLSHAGSVIALVVPGKTVELPGAVELGVTELKLVDARGRALPDYAPWGIGYGGVLADGDFGGRTFAIQNAIFDYRGRLRAVLIARNASVLAAFSDGTLEAFGPQARELYRCAIDGERYPAEDCADAFERTGELNALVDEPLRVPSTIGRHGQQRTPAPTARD